MIRFGLTVCLIVLSSFAVAEMAGAEKVEVSVDVENFRKSPNGKILATVNKGTQLQVLGKRGRWYKVQLTGWVWRPESDAQIDPSAQESTDHAPQDQAALPPAAPVEIARKQIQWLPQDFHRQEPPKRAHLRIALWFQNHESYRLNSVNYLLELIDTTGEVLYSEEVDRAIRIEADHPQPHSLHQIVERGGPSGQLYRTLRKAALQGELEVKVTLRSAFFTDAGRVPLSIED